MAIPVPEKRIADFENMGLGMFIHWGLYSQLGKGEWALANCGLSKDEYRKLFDTFTAKDFDAGKIVRMAKNAGMKYITLTTRHHEGFSLYDTCGLNEYDAPHSPAGRDLIREFVNACNEEGIMPMFYHTTLDWNDERFENDFPAYLQYLRDSVEILCTNYGKIGGLWFDGNWSKPEGTDWEEDKLYAVIRKHQPDAIIVNNTGLGKLGETGNIELDSVTFEQGRPTPMNREGMPKYVAAEMCHTMHDHWGIGLNDLNYKSMGEIIETLCACRKVGANYLLNIGPDGDGNVVLMQQAILENLGRWVKDVGQCIYRGKPSEIKGVGKNFALEADGKAYLFIHDLRINGDPNVTVCNEPGAGPKTFENIKGDVKSVKWTDNGEELKFSQNGDKLTVTATDFPYGVQYVVRIAELSFS